MKLNPEHENALYQLVNDFETMSKGGNMSFLKEKDFITLINYYEEEFLFDKALSVADYALKQYGFSADFHIKKAQLLLAMRNSEKAMSSLDQAEIYAPAEVEIQILRAKVHTSMGDHSKALQLLNKTKDHSSESDLSKLLLCEAQVYECLKEFEQMFDCLIAAVNSDLDNEEALERIWVCTEFTKQYERSIEFHTKLINERPYSYLAWYNLGHAYACKGKYKKAIFAYEYSFLINEDYELGYRDCADLCFQIQNYDKALQYYQSTLDRFGPDSDLLANIGECYYNKNEFTKAKEYFNKASKLDPYNDEVYYYLGLCHHNDSRYVSAINAFFKAIEIEDRREEYFSNLAVSFAAIGEYSKANYYFLKATEIGPEQTSIWVQHVGFLIKIGEFERAMEVVDEAEFHAVGSELTYCKVACLYSLKERDKALELLGNVLSEEPEEVKTLYTILPDMKKDKEVKALINYFLSEE